MTSKDMTDNTELKPCPFCLGEAVLIQDIKIKVNHAKNETEFNEIYWIKCNECQFSSWRDLTSYDAITAWNKRR